MATEPAAQRSEPKGGSIVADRYRIDRLIARGGMAAVYLAQHVKLNRPVALKVLSPPADAEDPQSFEDRFKLEAETLSALDHPNIVIVHDFGEMEDGRFFLAMEYIDGPRLTDLVKEEPLQPERAMSLILQVCAALRYAHKRGVVHRDLKPSNILVKNKDNGEEFVKVVDFGLVKLTAEDQSITRAGLILGSPHCMAPEQIKGGNIDHRCDIYATGILLFRLVTGTYPFHGANSAATMIQHLNAPTPTFFSVKPDLVAPAGLEEIVRKCLEKSPADRYADMQALMNDLATVMNLPPEQYKTSSTATNNTIERVQTPAPPQGASSAVVAVAAAAGAAVVALLALVGVIGLAAGFGLSQGAAVPPGPVVVTAPATPIAPATAPVTTVPATAGSADGAPAGADGAPAGADGAPAGADGAPVGIATDPGATDGTATTPATTLDPPPAKKPPPKKPPAKVDSTETKAESKTDAKTETKTETPAGYMGLPDDFQ